MTYEIEPIVQDNNRCGEGPIWDPDAGRIIWVDNSSDLVFDWTPANRQKRILSRGLTVGAVALTETDALVFAGATGLHIWHGQDNYRTVASAYEGEPFFFNDIIADPRGRIYAGTLYWGAEGMEKYGKLYLFDTDGSIRIVDDGIELANGLGFSPDNQTLYFTDSSARKIFAYDVAPRTGNLSRKRTLIQVPGDEGIPDGLTVDREGFIWSAQWYGAQIVRYDADGKVERRIPMPVQQVSSLIFGGPDYTDIYVTSAGECWRGPYAPPGYNFDAPNIGGSLYCIHQEITGRPEYRARVR